MKGPAVIGTLRHRLAQTKSATGPAGAVLAAVLVPMIESESGWSLIFTVRSDNLSSHRSEISFPGGSVDPGESTAEAAVREAHEELGIVPDHVELLGMLPRVFTVASNFLIEPWIGIVPRTEMAPNPHEIAEVLEIPLEVLLQPATRREQRFISGGGIYLSPAFDVGTHTIWGATARILESLLEHVE